MEYIVFVACLPAWLTSVNACFQELTVKENCRIMERILAFSGQKTLGKRRIIRLQNTGKCMQNTAFSVSSLFIFRTVNAMFFAVLVNRLFTVF